MVATLRFVAAKAFLASAALLALASATVQAQTPRVDRISIVEAGIYSVEITKKTPDPTDPTGFLNTIGETKLIKRTATIPAKQGVHFGIRSAVVGGPKDGQVDIRIVSKFPAPGLRNPSTGEILFRSEYTDQRKIGTTDYNEYYLEGEWEAVPGVWTFEFWYKDRKLAQQVFTLVKP
jgi:hypothetical protein